MEERKEGLKGSAGNPDLASYDGLDLLDIRRIAKAQPMANENVRRHLENIPGWKIAEGKYLARAIVCESQEQMQGVIDAVYRLAEEQDHHPEEGVQARGLTITYRFRTHSADAITVKDLAMAAKINKLLEKGGIRA